MKNSPTMPIDKTRYDVAYFHTENGAIRIPEPVADYIVELEDEVTKRNTIIAHKEAKIVELESRSLWQRITNKGIK